MSEYQSDECVVRGARNWDRCVDGSDDCRDYNRYEKTKERNAKVNVLCDAANDDVNAQSIGRGANANDRCYGRDALSGDLVSHAIHRRTNDLRTPLAHAGALTDQTGSR